VSFVNSIATTKVCFQFQWLIRLRHHLVTCRVVGMSTMWLIRLWLSWLKS
jgi:hypothetical protein